MDDVKKGSSLPQSIRTEKLNYFAKLDCFEQINVLEIQTKLLRLNFKKTKKTDADTVLYCLLQAITEYQDKNKKITTKDGGGILTGSELMQQRMRALKTEKETEKQRAYRTRCHAAVVELRSNGSSWRDIVKYLKRHHRFTISHTGLLDLYKRYAK